MDNFRKRLDSWQGIHDEPPAGDTELRDTAAVIADEQSDANPYTPPLPVPLSHRVEGATDQLRLPQSEVWLVNPPASLPGLGVLVMGGQAERGSQFAIHSIRIDNLTSSWIYFPEIGAFVPPFWYGRVLRYDGSRVQRVRFETPTGLTALTVAATEVARVVFSNDYWPENAGSSMAGNVAPGGQTPTPTVAIADESTGIIAEVVLSADALVNQDGLVTNSLGYSYNGATWDRMRTTATAIAITNTGIQAVGLHVTDGSNIRQVAAYSALGDGDTGRDSLPVGTQRWNGAQLDRDRVANVFKTFGPLAIAASSTAVVWTPATGKKPRLMGFLVNQTSIATVDGIVTFFDNTTTGAVLSGTGWLNAPGLGIGSTPSTLSLGNGPIVATSSNVILAWSSNAINIAGMVFGTEE